MPRSRAILIALIAAVLGFVGGTLTGLGSSPPIEDNERFQRVQQAFNETNHRLLRLTGENNNLRDQIGVLEKMVETLSAEIEEINAVVDAPGRG